jgi:DNA-binding response OmpR family regulator
MSIRVLVVEDDFLIAIDIGQQLANAGFEVVGPASSVAGALNLVAEAGCDVAILNVKLGDETSEPIARKLEAAGKPFVVLSGYPTERLPPLFNGATVLTKPCPTADLLAAVRGAARSQSNLTEGSL